MAKRKSAAKKATRKSTPAARTAGRGGSKSAGRKKSAAKGRGKVSASSKRIAKAAKKAPKKAAKRPVAKKLAAKAAKAPAKAPVRKVTKAAKAAAPVSKKAVAPKKAVVPAKAAAPKKKAAKRALPGTERAPIPSSLKNLDQSSSQAKSGRQEMREQLKSHNESSPALTGGDVDANWEGAYSSGDEAPGGDNPTPDQDVVDEIGHALGVEYDDNEELKGADKISDRDKHRWELNPASSEDFRNRK